MGRKKENLLFEVSWEVCNKVGGINTVVKSKAPSMINHYGQNYFLVGPYFPKKSLKEFQERIPPDNLDSIFKRLGKEGIICHYGEWLILGQPKTILVDFTNYAYKKDEIKGWLWEKYGIDSMNSNFNDFDEPVIWGYACGRLLEEISKAYDMRVLAHFHEWLTGSALLYLKGNNVGVATVFTTHATMLGRTMAGNNVELYGMIDKIDPVREAYKWNVHSKHQTESAAALNSDVFTTVSETTAIEAKHILKRWPDVLLFNGLDIGNYPSFEEVSIKHRLYKDKIKSFLEYYFFPYYSFDLDNTLIYFISGRYEFHNKGIDVLIQALARLNDKLKSTKSRKSIAVFFWIPKEVARIKPDILQSRAYYKDMEEYLDDNMIDVKSRIMLALITKKPITEENLLSKEFIFETNKRVMNFLKKGSPPLCTHDMHNEDSDPIIQSFKQHGLLNRIEDRVKVMFYPTYLTGADNLLDLSYDEAIIGSHLGVFPSYYEPWGYTPMETGALGVASVTTDFSGFGRCISKNLKKNPGIFVINMFNRTKEEGVENLFKMLYDFTNLDKESRIKNKIEARKIAFDMGWDRLTENYIKAHTLALKKAHK
ncbi:MAG: glycogen/starch synthase [Candidatus Altiarchaeota archaeon]|nr:glycogen/starch synthase [Candidatus Altiarchaeota archaeon]